MRIRQLNHSTYQHHYHIVWGTKYRRKILKPYVHTELQKILYGTVKKYPTLYIQSFNTDQDHLHIQIEIAPNTAVSDVVRVLKTASCKHLRKKFKFIREIYIETDGIWSVGYFSSTIGVNEETIRHYIKHQGEQDEPQDSTLFN